MTAVRFQSDRRTFLSGGGAIAVIGALPVAAKDAVSPRDFGALGNGTTNDLEAVTKALTHALDNGYPVDGGDSLYGVAGEVTISNRVRPFISRLRLKQLSPLQGRITLEFKKCEQVQIDSLFIHTGDSKNVGHMDKTVGLQILGGTGHRIRNVTATGNGKVTYVRFWRCTGSSFDSIHVHDGEFEDFDEEKVTQDGVYIGTIRVPDDVVQGIHLADCRDCNLVNPIVRNLTGNARTFNTALQVKDYANFRTRGIAGGGNMDCTVVNPRITNVEQAIDFAGGGDGWGNRNVQIIGGQTRNCGSVGVKFANLPNGCKVIGHTAHNCGMYGFLLTGGEASAQGSGNSFINCEAINPGYNDVHNDTDSEPLAHAGFTLQQSGSGGLVGSRLIGCQATDHQGFYLSGDDSPWAAADATSATMDEAWTGYTGTYPATFKTSSGNESRQVMLTTGSTNVSWTQKLVGAIVHPFVSRPAKMQYGALCEAPYFPESGRPNTIESFRSYGHIKAAHKGFTVSTTGS
jgi:hypothetical protein